MLFSSVFFIFAFLPLFYISYLFTPKKFKNIALLIASLGFYFWGEPLFCFIAIASAMLDYVLCKKIYTLEKSNAEKYLILGICANLGLLIYFKYTNFFLKAITTITAHHADFDALNIILPIGISFIVFEKITYLVDVYRGDSKPANNIINYLTYVFLFPKLLAGPIIKYHEIAHQLHQRAITHQDFSDGLKRFLRGLAKKVFIADVCGAITNQIFALPSTELSFAYAWIGIMCFSLQIYFDFSGYSDMALGLARMLGFRLRENFNMPYIAESFTDFWRRWHISLSSWIREYLYIPLGGNRASPARIYINLWLCFLLSGLWHGANWTFVLWGAYHGLFLIIDKLFWLKFHTHIPKHLRVGITLFLVMLGWVIFRANDFAQIIGYFHALANPWQATQSYVDITNDVYFSMLLGFFLALLPLARAYPNLQGVYLTWKWRIHFEGFCFGILGFLVISKIIATSYTPFLYFKF